MQVFLSYTEKERKWAKKIAADLRASGLTLWDPEEEISAGDNWALRIGNALERADAMVVLISPDSMASERVRRELDYALSSPRFQGHLIPVQVKRTANLPWILKKFQFIDATRNSRGVGKRIAEALVQSSEGARR